MFQSSRQMWWTLIACSAWAAFHVSSASLATFGNSLWVSPLCHQVTDGSTAPCSNSLWTSFAFDFCSPRHCLGTWWQSRYAPARDSVSWRPRGRQWSTWPNCCSSHCFHCARLPTCLLRKPWLHRLHHPRTVILSTEVGYSWIRALREHLNASFVRQAESHSRCFSRGSCLDQCSCQHCYCLQPCSSSHYCSLAELEISAWSSWAYC